MKPYQSSINHQTINGNLNVNFYNSNDHKKEDDEKYDSDIKDMEIRV